MGSVSGWKVRRVRPSCSAYDHLQLFFHWHLFSLDSFQIPKLFFILFSFLFAHTIFSISFRRNTLFLHSSYTSSFFIIFFLSFFLHRGWSLCGVVVNVLDWNNPVSVLDPQSRNYVNFLTYPWERHETPYPSRPLIK